MHRKVLILRLRQDNAFEYGYNSITEMNGKHSEMLMDFGILKLKKGMTEESSEDLERAYLLISGSVTFQWEDNTQEVSRINCFDVDPYCLHVPSGVTVKMTCNEDDTEISVQKTNNKKTFDSSFYAPGSVRSEMRGAGTMNEASTRNVRTIFDKTNAPDANLVLGEVIGYPGKWSSYPPHHHPQPEIYFYKYNPSHGYSFSELGEDVIKLQENDTVLIDGGLTHPQVVAPGYAVYYIWAIRHLDKEDYITPTFVDEHTWVMESDAKIWPNK